MHHAIGKTARIHEMLARALAKGGGKALILRAGGSHQVIEVEATEGPSPTVSSHEVERERTDSGRIDRLEGRDGS